MPWLPQADALRPDVFMALLRHTCVLYGVAVPQKVLIAVSGGSDSMALLSAAAQALPCYAVTIHYHLRAQADAEAALVANHCQRWGVPNFVAHVPLIAGNGMQKRARMARYQWLEHLAQQYGAQAILVGHTAHDIAETVLQRIVQHTHVNGLMGIAAVAQLRHSGVSVIRPWWQIGRYDLQNALQRRGIAWATDASNNTSVRGYWRARGEALAQQGMSWQHCFALAQNAMLWRQYQAVQAAALWRQHVTRLDAHTVCLQPMAAQSPFFPRLAGFLLHSIGGMPYAVSDADAAQALHILCAGKNAPLPNGCVGRVRKTGVYITREQRRTGRYVPLRATVAMINGADLPLARLWYNLGNT